LYPISPTPSCSMKLTIALVVTFLAVSSSVMASDAKPAVRAQDSRKPLLAAPVARPEVRKEVKHAQVGRRIEVRRDMDGREGLRLSVLLDGVSVQANEGTVVSGHQINAYSDAITVQLTNGAIVYLTEPTGVYHFGQVVYLPCTAGAHLFAR